MQADFCVQGAGNKIYTFLLLCKGTWTLLAAVVLSSNIFCASTTVNFSATIYHHLLYSGIILYYKMEAADIYPIRSQPTDL